MKKTSLTVLAFAAILGIFAAATVGINHSNKINEIHEVKANGEHQHDGVTFATPLTESFFDCGDVESGNYYLESDITIDSTTKNKYVNIGSGETVSICLNGHAIKGNGGTPSSSVGLFNVKDGGILKIYDCNQNKLHSYNIVDNLAIVDDEYSSDSQAGFFGGFFHCFNYPLVTTSGTGAIYWYGGTVIGNSGVYDPFDSSIGQFVMLNGGRLNIRGGSFIGNKNSGTMIFADGNSTVNIDKASDNSNNLYFGFNTGNDAGVIFAGSDTFVEVRNSRFLCNSNLNADSGYGGVIYANGDLDCKNCQFEQNTAVNGYGGAVAIIRPYECGAGRGASFESCEFLGNEAHGVLDDDHSGGEGGAVYVRTSHPSDETNLFAFTNCSFDRNSATNCGGAIYLMDRSNSNSWLDIQGSTFGRNYVDTTAKKLGLGGAICVQANTDNIDSETPLPTSGFLNLSDASFGSNFGSEGGAIYFEATAGLRGSIFSNDTRFAYNDAARRGGAISIKSSRYAEDVSLTLANGTSISSNTTKGLGGGVYADNVLIKFWGAKDVVVKDNKGTNDTVSNIYLPRKASTLTTATKNEESYIVFDGTPLGENSSIGISMEVAGDFTKNVTEEISSANVDYFFSDDSDYFVSLNSETDQLTLSVPHTHSWSYTAIGNKITAACSNPDCPVTEGLTLELEAPASLTYDGNAKVASLKTGYSSAAFPNPTIKYYQGTAEAASCVNAGTYTAKVTYGDATAELEFTIAKATPTPTAVTDRNAVYGQSLSDIELPDGWTWNTPTDKVGNVGTRVHKATFTPEDADDYNTVEQDVNVIVAKADPEYTVPTGIKALHDKTLSTVTLPTGWSWDEPTTNVGSELGNKVFKATFTPADTDNYNIVEHVDVTVEVVDHEHAWTYTANDGSITAVCGNPECPVTTGLTLTLEAPSGQLYYDGEAKLAVLKAGYSEEAFPNIVVKYFQGTTEVNECVNVGKYTAKVTFGNATAEVSFEILGKTIVDPTQSAASVEIDDAVVPENITLRVEVRTDVVEKDIAEDYAKIQAKLEQNEQISKVYDVKLIQTTGGIEKEIQPSDIQPGLKITVKMAIPEGIDIAKSRILHIHNVNDMEFVTDYKVEGNDIVFEIDRLSQFAFINKVETGLPGWAIALIVIGGLLLLCCLFIIILFFIRPKYTIDYTKKKVIRVIITRKHDNILLLRDVRLRKIRRNEEDVYKNKDDASNALEEHLKQ
ncbi:MAG: hypothetical protein E7178_05145 [Erysipelotrichaceae bacterium]|jgi:hypothetical protein|nr:hypothetical protein [Erysipelotrichaceae bacterium]